MIDTRRVMIESIRYDLSYTNPCKLSTNTLSQRFVLEAAQFNLIDRNDINISDLKTINIADLSLGKQINYDHRRMNHAVVSFSFDMLLIFVILFINQTNEILKRKSNKNKRFWLIFVVHYISCNHITISYFIQMIYIVSYSWHSEYVIKMLSKMTSQISVHQFKVNRIHVIQLKI